MRFRVTAYFFRHLFFITSVRFFGAVTLKANHNLPHRKIASEKQNTVADFARKTKRSNRKKLKLQNVKAKEVSRSSILMTGTQPRKEPVAKKIECGREGGRDWDAEDKDAVADCFSSCCYSC